MTAALALLERIDRETAELELLKQDVRLAAELNRAWLVMLAREDERVRTPRT